MPELPEVETVRRGLQPVMEGARIVTVEQRRPDLRFPFPERFARRLQNRRIEALGRRAKYLIIHLDDGLCIISHLGMSGSYRIEMDGATHHDGSKNALHDHLVIHIERKDGGAARIVYNDPRRFGFIVLAEAGQLDSHPSVSGLGVEPTGNALSGALLAHLFGTKKAPLKAVLLDQRLIAGLGNIYVCEALWRAGLSPVREAGTLTAPAEADALAFAIRDVIAEAIAAGGSSLRDHRQTDGTLGYFQHRFSVYDREGTPCPRPGCGGTIARIVQSGRSTFFCARCQR